MKPTVRRAALRIAFLAVILALTFLTSLFPFVFLFPLIIAAIVGGLYEGVIASAMFACVSIIYAYTMPSSAVAQVFMMAPWLAIVPRLPIGAVCFFAYKGMTLLTRRMKNQALRHIIPCAVAGAAATLTNSVLVLSCMATFYGDVSIGNGTLLLAIPQMMIYGVIELAIAAVITPPLVWALKKLPMFKESAPAAPKKEVQEPQEVPAEAKAQLKL